MFLNTILSLFCYRRLVTSLARRERLDEIITNPSLWKWSQCLEFETGSRPTDGVHWVWMGGGFFFAVKRSLRSEHRGTEHSYELFIFGRSAYAALENRLEGDKNMITIMSCKQPNIFNTACHAKPYRVLHTPFGWQSSLIDIALKAFEEKQRFSVLIFGPPGRGKTEFGKLLNMALKIKRSCEPMTIKVNPTDKGLLLSDLFVNPLVERPIVLVWNEYHRIVAHAESNSETASDGKSMAGNVTELFETLDEINETRNMIFIATMSEDPMTLKPEFRRPGRFDLIFDADKE